MNKLDPNIFLQKIKKANQETLESFKKHCSSNVNGNDSRLSELSLIQHCQDLQTRSDQALNIVKNCQDEINMSEPLRTLLNCEKLQVWGGFLVKNLDNFDELSVAKNGNLIMVDGFKNSGRFLEGSVRLLSLFDEVTESLSLLEGKVAAKDRKIAGIVGEFFTLGVVLFFLSDLMSLTKSQVLKIVSHELASYEKLKSSASVRGGQADIDALKAVVQAMTALKMVAVEPTVGLLKCCMEGSAECRQLLNDWVFSNVVTAVAPAKMSAAAGNTRGGLEVCAQLVHRGVVEYDIYSMCGTYSVVQLDADTVGEIFYGDVVGSGSDSLRNEAVLSEKRQDVVESVARMVLQGRLVCHVEQRADDGTPTIVFGNDDNNNSNSNNSSQPRPRPDAARYLAQVLANLEKIGISK